MLQPEDVNVSTVQFCRAEIGTPFAKLVKNENPFFPSRMRLDNHWLFLSEEKLMITADVRFIRKYLYSMGEKYSKFRGKGRISFEGDSFDLTGKRIYQPMILRAALILFAALLFGLIFQLNFLLLLMVMLLWYYLLQYVLLKKESLTLSWSQITKYEIDDRKKQISFSIENNSKCSLIVFTTESFIEIAGIFRESIRDYERTSHGWTAVEQRYDEQMNSMGKSVDSWFKGKRR